MANEIRTLNPSAVFSRFKPAQAGVVCVAKASGINNRIEEKALLSNPKYSHTWLMNLDAVPMDYAKALKGLVAAYPNGIPYDKLNGFNVVIKVRVDVGEPDPQLLMRGEEVKFVMSSLVSKEGEILTHNTNQFLAGLPLYEVRKGSYEPLAPKELSWDSEPTTPRDTLPTTKSETPTPTKAKASIEDLDDSAF